ncbi:MAG: metallophosphoesterase [Johnsonella sp.]|nr:metallophosphoesterase [Johnsonella sp.]
MKTDFAEIFKKLILPLLILFTSLLLLLLLEPLFRIERGRKGEPAQSSVEETSSKESGKKESRDPAASASSASEPERERMEESKAEHKRGGMTESPPSFDGEKKEEESRQPVDEHRIYLITDGHYFSPDLTDYQEAYQEAMGRDDGKNIEDIREITQIWVDEVFESRPKAVILSGDITLDGEKQSHLELESLLRPIYDAGILVLVVPGNHDINNHRAGRFEGEKKLPTDTVSPEEFLEIYYDFGYSKAYARDEHSLSYIYQLDETRFLLMLDSSVYIPENKVYGTIKEETLQWLENELPGIIAKDAYIISVAHHNLLPQSRFYTDEVTLTNYRELVALHEKFGIGIWLSGHLHLQRIKSYKNEPGDLAERERTTELVTGPFATYPYPYADIYWDEDCFIYTRKETKAGEELRQRGLEIFAGIIGKQIDDITRGLPEDIEKEISDQYVRLLAEYISGNAVDEKEFKTSTGYFYIDKYMSNTQVMEDIEKMLADCKEDHHYFYHRRKRGEEREGISQALSE